MGVAEMVATDSRAKCHVCLDGSDGFVEAKLHSGGRVYLPLCRRHTAMQIACRVASDVYAVLPSEACSDEDGPDGERPYISFAPVRCGQDACRFQALGYCVRPRSHVELVKCRDFRMRREAFAELMDEIQSADDDAAPGK